MFKLSFKNGNPISRIDRDGDVTTVTIIGRLKIPKRYQHIPNHILDWMITHESVEVNIDIAHEEFIIKTSGSTTKAKEDEENRKFAETVAESKAKRRIYKFMYMFLFKMWKYYHFLITGSKIPSANIKFEKESLFDDILKFRKLHSVEDERLYCLIRGK